MATVGVCHKQSLVGTNLDEAASERTQCTKDKEVVVMPYYAYSVVIFDYNEKASDGAWMYALDKVYRPSEG